MISIYYNMPQCSYPRYGCPICNRNGRLCDTQLTHNLSKYLICDACGICWDPNNVVEVPDTLRIIFEYLSANVSGIEFKISDHTSDCESYCIRSGKLKIDYGHVTGIVRVCVVGPCSLEYNEIYKSFFSRTMSIVDNEFFTKLLDAVRNYSQFGSSTY